MTEPTRPSTRAATPEAPRPGSGEGALRHSGRGFLLALYTGLRSLKLYPIENATAQKALDDLQAAAVNLLASEEEIELRISGDFLFINATRLRLELENYASFSYILATFASFDIGTLRVRQGVERREWQIFVGLLLNLASMQENPDKLMALSERLQSAAVTHIEVEPTVETQEQLDELERAKELAKRTYSQGVAVTKEVVNSVRMGRTASIKKVKRAVQAIVDQVLNNETSLMGLTTIRDYDEYTFTHSVNVCIFSVALGRRVGFTRLQLYDLGLAALMHDIGKARIPIDILNKTSGLDEKEWFIIQAHPWLGALTLFEMRGYSEIPYRSIVVAHEHHMKIDLTGYPRVVRERELGLFSRIVAVADGFDAATTRRSYQSVPIQPDEVLREMWENPRRGYDHIIVKALINLIGVYPVGTCVILDTFEVAVVSAANPDPEFLNRPLVKLVIDADGAVLPPPSRGYNLAERDASGAFLRSIVKVTNPDRYGLTVGDYFV
jgi:HD-GYP domain-containing protein (c-di-GMP phosphodiesterase class II)